MTIHSKKRELTSVELALACHVEPLTLPSKHAGFAEKGLKGVDIKPKEFCPSPCRDAAETFQRQDGGEEPGGKKLGLDEATAIRTIPPVLRSDLRNTPIETVFQDCCLEWRRQRELPSLSKRQCSPMSLNSDIRKAMIQAATHSTYDPNQLLNTLIVRLGLRCDGALSRKLKVARGVIGNIRSGRIQVCGSMLLWMHEATGLSIEELRRLMGDRRAKCRLGVSIRPAMA